MPLIFLPSSLSLAPFSSRPRVYNARGKRASAKMSNNARARRQATRRRLESRLPALDLFSEEPCVCVCVSFALSLVHLPKKALRFDTRRYCPIFYNINHCTGIQYMLVLHVRMCDSKLHLGVGRERACMRACDVTNRRQQVYKTALTADLGHHIGHLADLACLLSVSRMHYLARAQAHECVCVCALPLSLCRVRARAAPHFFPSPRVFVCERTQAAMVLPSDWLNFSRFFSWCRFIEAVSLIGSHWIRWLNI